MNDHIPWVRVFYIVDPVIFLSSKVYFSLALVSVVSFMASFSIVVIISKSPSEVLLNLLKYAISLKVSKEEKAWKKKMMKESNETKRKTINITSLHL